MLLFIAIAALALTSRVAEAADKPRNVIWLLNDQENNHQWFPKNWDDIHLPFLKTLEKNGMSFTNAWTNANMCSSARASMFTGLHVAQHQVSITLTSANYQSQWEPQLHPDQWNAASIMADNGYEVVYFGKWHMSKGYFNITTGKYINDDVSRYGFGTQEGPGNWNGEPPLGTRGVGGFGAGYSNLDEYAVQNASIWVKDRLERQAAGEDLKPFFMIVSIWNPHDMPISYPGVPPMFTNFTQQNNSVTPKYIIGGYTESITHPTVPLVEVPPTNTESLPYIGTGDLGTYSGLPYYTEQTTIKPVLETYYLLSTNAGLGPCYPDDTNCHQLYVNMYANCIKLADERFEQFYNETRAMEGGVEFWNSAIVLKTSDHGEMQMAHGGQRQKPFLAYRETLGIKVTWSNPILWPEGMVSDSLISHIDHLPTMLDYLGINPKKYKLPGKSYARVFEDPTLEVQDHVLFQYNDHWATFDYVIPAPLNLVFNIPNWPIINASNGPMPSPHNLYVLTTRTHTAGLYYDQANQYAVEDVTVCYDNTPEGGDWDEKYGAPLQLNNLSPWAVKIREAFNLPQVGTQKQLDDCHELLKKLRKVAEKELAPIKKFKMEQPRISASRIFEDKQLCKNMCMEHLFNSRAGQSYTVQAVVNGTKMTLWNYLVPQADMTGSYELKIFNAYVPGNNGPIAMTVNLPQGTDMDTIVLATSASEQRRASKDYVGVLPPPPGCLESCPFTNVTYPQEEVIMQLTAYFQHQH